MRALLKAALAAATLTTSMTASAASYFVMGAPGADLEAAVAKAGGKVRKHLAAIDAVVAEGSDSFEAAIAKQPGVEGAAPDARVTWKAGVRAQGEASVAAGVEARFGKPPTPPASGVPVDTIGSGDPFLGLQWGHAAVRAPEAWAQGHRGAGARVAVLDTGFILTHPDLAGRIDEGCTADMTGEGLETGVMLTANGMHVAGTIAANADGAGTIGIAPEATLCLVKVASNQGGLGNVASMSAGIVHAANQNVDVITVGVGAVVRSSGVPGEYTAKEARDMLRLVERAVKYAYRRGALVIAAAGDEGLDRDAGNKLIRLPADAADVLSVSATAPEGWRNDPATSLDQPTSYGNFGRSTDLTAPGGEQRASVTGSCTWPGIGPARPCSAFDMVFSTGGRVGALHTYYWSAGTSMAAAHAAGVAALIVGKYGHMHPAQLRAYLNRGTDDLGRRGRDDTYGVGRVNALESVAR